MFVKNINISSANMIAVAPHNDDASWGVHAYSINTWLLLF
jgi:hypothetical protein